MPGRPRRQRTLGVWTNGLRVGRWSVGSTGGHSLAYERDWIDSPQGRPLSLSLPFTPGGRALRGAKVQSFFEHLLPAAPLARQRLQAFAGAASPEAFSLLAVLGRDCAGAVQLLPDDAEPGDAQRVDGEPLPDRDLVRLLDALAAEPGTAPPADLPVPAVALSGTGAKTALLWHDGRWCLPGRGTQGATPSTHILKLPLGAKPGGAPAHNTSLENEWLCVRLFTEFGFELPVLRIDTIGAHKVLVAERTDRRWVDGRWWARLPGEDLAQATGTPPHQVAESAGGPGLARLLELLRGSDEAARDRERLLVATVLMWMLAVPDVSARRFRLRLLPAGHFALAPLSGVMSAWPVMGRHPSPQSLARLSFGLSPDGQTAGHAAITRQAWLQAAQRHALGASFDAVLSGLAAWSERAIERVSADLPERFPGSVSGPVFEGLRRCARMLGAG
jgi:serine/threonine-protein kinase HipA